MDGAITLGESIKPAPKRRTGFLAVFAMLLASFVALAVGVVGLAMWPANLATFAPASSGAANAGLVQALFVFLSAGPVIAGAGLALGWILFIARRPGAAWRAAAFPALAWGVSVLAYLAAAASVCEGSFTCGL